MTMKKRNDHWEELQRAIKSIFKKGNSCSEEVKMFFFKLDKPDEISLVIEGIDNSYISHIGSKHNWELYLKKDGTWRIV